MGFMKFAPTNWAVAGHEAAISDQAVGLRANAPHITIAATCGSFAAQRAATRPENDSATSTGRDSAVDCDDANRAYPFSVSSVRLGYPIARAGAMPRSS